MILSAAGTTPRILVYDEDPGVLELEKEILQFAGYDVTAGETADATIERAADGEFDLVVIDLGRKGRNEFLLLDRLVAVATGVSVIVLSGFDAASAVQAIRRGAYGFLTKPIDVDRFLETVHATLRSSRTSRARPDDTVPFLGTGESMEVVYRRAGEASDSSGNVMILGEPGTGKEALARAIYRNSPRSDQPFIRFVCAGMPAMHLAEDLFGRSTETLPDGSGDGSGLLKRVGRGTVLIQDPDMLPPETQYLLLETLQKGLITPVGGDASLPMEARLISTIRTRPGEEANLEPLRDDLCYLLGHVVISIPPLRERTDDIPGIVSHTLEVIQRDDPAPVLSDGLVELLKRHPWPGNLDQVATVVRQAAARRDVPLERALTEAIEHLPTGKSLRLGLAGLQGYSDQDPGDGGEQDD